MKCGKIVSTNVCGKMHRDFLIQAHRRAAELRDEFKKCSPQRQNARHVRLAVLVVLVVLVVVGSNYS